MSSGYEALRLTQLATMADPDRLRLLGATLTASTGTVSASELSDDGDVRVVREHLTAMVTAGLLSTLPGGDGEPRYRPTPDALVRFGGAALALPTVSEPEPVDPGDHTRLLERITAGLAAEHSQALSAETVDRFVRDSYDLLASRATVRQHLPALTARFAADRLSALVTAAQQHLPSATADVLFVCVRNAGRSQIAAAVLRSAVGDRVRVRTAGSRPVGTLDPAVHAELDRRGLAGLTELPRPLTDEVVRASGVVVTMGCGDACPVLPGRRYLDWAVDDPSGRPAAEVVRIVDDITARVNSLVAELFG